MNVKNSKIFYNFIHKCKLCLYHIFDKTTFKKNKNFLKTFFTIHITVTITLVYNTFIG